MAARSRPASSPPSLSNLTTSGGYTNGGGDYYIYPPAYAQLCPQSQANFNVTASDASGVDHVTFFYWPGGVGSPLSKQMIGNGDSWGTNITAQEEWADAETNEDPTGLISYWVVATDEYGNETTLNHSNSYRLYSGTCITG